MKKSFILFLLIALLPMLGYCQQDLYHFQLKTSVSVAQYYEKAKPLTDYTSLDKNFIYSLELSKRLSNTFGVAVAASMGHVKGNDTHQQEQKNEITAASARLYFYTDNGWLLPIGTLISPYLYGGYSAVHFRHSDGFSMLKESESHSDLLLGVGIKFRLAERWNLHVEAGANRPFVAPENIFYYQNAENNLFFTGVLAIAYNFGFRKSNFHAPRYFIGNQPRLVNEREDDLQIRKSNPSPPKTIDAISAKKITVAPAKAPDEISIVSLPRQYDLQLQVQPPVIGVAHLDSSEILDLPSVPVEMRTLQIIQDSVPVLEVPSPELKAKLKPINTGGMMDSITVISAEEVPLPKTERITIQQPPVAEGSAQPQKPKNESKDNNPILSNEKLVLASNERDSGNQKIENVSNRVDTVYILQQTLPNNTNTSQTKTTTDKSTFQSKNTPQAETVLVYQDRPIDNNKIIKREAQRKRDLNVIPVIVPRKTVSNNDEAVLQELKYALDSINIQNKMLLQQFRAGDSDSMNPIAEEDNLPFVDYDTYATLLRTRYQFLQLRLDAMQQDFLLKQERENNTAALEHLRDSIQQLKVLLSKVPPAAEYREIPLPPVNSLPSATLFYANGATGVPVTNNEAMLAVLKSLKEDAKQKVKVEGYSDLSGNPKINLAVSKRRAEATGRWLQKQGILGARIQIYFYGDTRATELNNPQDRKVEITVIR